MSINGFINLCKPKGYTSHQCISIIRKILNIKRVGHGGTLDPMATGVLPIGVGHPTRLFQYFEKSKEYSAQIQFGITTDSDDCTGEIKSKDICPWIEKSVVEDYLSKYKGNIQQKPPSISAIHINGKRMYELARNGELDETRIKLRQVYVSNIDVLNWYPDDYPKVDIHVSCGEGTYIRSIARDCGEALIRSNGEIVGANLTAIERTRSSAFRIEDSITIEQLKDQVQNKTFQILPADYALKHIPKVTLSFKYAKSWIHGKSILLSRRMFSNNEEFIKSLHSDMMRVYILDDSNLSKKFCGMARCVNKEHSILLKPKHVFPME